MRPYLALLLLAISVSQSAAAELSDLIARTKPSIVGVGTRMPSRRPPNRLLGTGFVVADGRTVVTNNHVVDVVLDTEKREVIAVYIAGERGSTYKVARVITRDSVHDLALLDIEGEPLPALTFADPNSAREGDDVFFTGFPMGITQES